MWTLISFCCKAIWGIGNISGDSVASRDKIISYGAVDLLVKLLNRTIDESIVKQGLWALSNLCRGKPLPAFSKIYKAIEPLVNAIKTQTDMDTIADAAWALSYISGRILFF